ncbi:alpha/beta hydrolase [Burkholderia stagnalis]
MSRDQRKAVDALLRQGANSFTPQPVEAMREKFAALMALFPVPEVRQSAIRLGDCPAVLVEPAGESRPGTILYFHGGGFVLGSPATAMGLTASLVARTGFRAISLDYRLAPEHPFPAAIEDGVAAYRALLESGVDSKTIAFAGDSAGGGLTVTTTLAAREAALALPGAIVAFSPGLDLTRSGRSVETKAGVDPFLTREGMRHTGDLYLAGQNPLQALASPAVSADLTGFPPILLQVGTNEMLLDDSVRLAERARDAEVDVVLDVTAGVPHVFQSFIGQLDEADQALERAALFLRQHLRSPDAH